MPNKPPHAAFAGRLFAAQKRWELRNGRDLEREAFAVAVGKAVKRGRPFSSGTVSQWFLGNQMPSVEQLAAIARVLDTDPGWLAFGDQSAMTGPDGEPLGDSSPDGPDHRQQWRRGGK
jgi:transcriptional regulator with XRE-family HTH domain